MSVHCKLDTGGRLKCHSQEDCNEGCILERKKEEEQTLSDNK